MNIFLFEFGCNKYLGGGFKYFVCSSLFGLDRTYGLKAHAEAVTSLNSGPHSFSDFAGENTGQGDQT